MEKDTDFTAQQTAFRESFRSKIILACFSENGEHVEEKNAKQELVKNTLTGVLKGFLGWVGYEWHANFEVSGVFMGFLLLAAVFLLLSCKFEMIMRNYFHLIKNSQI